MWNFWKNKLLPVLPFVVVFIASFYPVNDADLGWHLKYGEYFFKHFRILRENTFSQLMPTYHWVNSSWATDLISYATFHTTGFLGLTVLSAFVVMLTFYFFSKAAQLNLFAQAILFPVILFYESPLNGVSFRGQQMTLLFLGILLFILNAFSGTWGRKLFLLAPLFLIWVNVHGEFLLGLGVLVLWFALSLLSEAAEKRDFTTLAVNLRKYGIIILVCVAATLINPFGFSVYFEASHHFFNPWQKYIAEWLPFDQLSTIWWNHVTMGMFICLGVISLFFTGRIRRNIPYLGITIVFFALSFLMRRYAWPLYYITFFSLKPIPEVFNPPNQKLKTNAISIILLIALGLAVILRTPITRYTNQTWESYCRIRGCSSQAAKFLMQNGLTDPKKLYTVYDWGGWLIWNYPQIKPTIDGRMHLWRDDKGYSGFSEYYPIEQNWAGHDIDDSRYEIAFVSPQKTVYKHLLDLVTQGKWKMVYKDRWAGVFVKAKL